MQAFAHLNFLSIQDDSFVNMILSEGCGSVHVVKEFEKTVQECLNGVNPDDSASHLLSLKKDIWKNWQHMLPQCNPSDPVSDY